MSNNLGRIVTLEQLTGFVAHWDELDRKYVAAAFEGKEWISALDVLAKDIAWGIWPEESQPGGLLEILLRPEFMTHYELNHLACDYAERASYIFPMVFEPPAVDHLSDALRACRRVANGDRDGEFAFNTSLANLTGYSGDVWILAEQIAEGGLIKDGLILLRFLSAINAARFALTGRAYRAFLAAEAAIGNDHKDWDDWALEQAARVIRGEI